MITYTKHPDVSVALIKAASWYKDPANVISAAAAASPFIGMGIDQASGYLQRRRDEKEKALSYAAMIRRAPSFKRDNPADVKDAYNVLWATNPIAAKSPLLAGDFVSTVLSTKGRHPGRDQVFGGAVNAATGVADLGRSVSTIRRDMGPQSSMVPIMSEVGKNIARGTERYNALARERDDANKRLEDVNVSLQAEREVAKQRQLIDAQRRATAEYQVAERSHRLGERERKLEERERKPWSPGPATPSGRRRIVEMRKSSSAHTLRALLGR